MQPDHWPKMESMMARMENMPLNTWRLGKLVLRACEFDDVARMAHCVSMAHRDDSTVTLSETLHKGLMRSLQHNAKRCLAYVLEQGTVVTNLDPDSTIPRDASVPPRETLDLLLAHGWNMNIGSATQLLWLVVSDHELVVWCLDHGADVDPVDNRNFRGTVPILERAASGGNIHTFELLRARGAPVNHTFGLFPRAVMSANGWLGDGAKCQVEYERQLDMLRHLLDVVKCDVNSCSYGAHYILGSGCINALCWIACHPKGAKAKELIWLLLDYGNDPDLTWEPQGASEDGYIVPSARMRAKNRLNHDFLNAVEEWEANHPNRQRHSALEKAPWTMEQLELQTADPAQRFLSRMDDA